MNKTELNILKFHNDIIYTAFDGIDERYNPVVLLSVQASILSDLGKTLEELSTENSGLEFHCNAWWDNRVYPLIKIDFDEEDEFNNIYFYYRNSMNFTSWIAAEYVFLKKD